MNGHFLEICFVAAQTKKSKLFSCPTIAFTLVFRKVSIENRVNATTNCTLSRSTNETWRPSSGAATGHPRSSFDRVWAFGMKKMFSIHS